MAISIESQVDLGQDEQISSELDQDGKHQNGKRGQSYNLGQRLVRNHPCLQRADKKSESKSLESKHDLASKPTYALKDATVKGHEELLSHINQSADVRALKREQLPQLCTEVRDCLIDTVSRTAGHLASGLGVVELTVALHYVFDTPHDVIMWDVGHQAYPHKILTGNREALPTIRHLNGLHAFIWRNETPYDHLCTGHASTSIGSALGMALAQRFKPKEQKRKVVAVIGDGALSGGCAFEALNHAGTFKKDIDLTVILNDNEMSISENVGSMAQGLSHVLSSPHYVKLIEGGKRILSPFPAMKNLAMRAQEHFKGMLMPGTLFEEFGFNYIGPVDGHDVQRLVSILQNIRDMSGLNFVHIITKKGKGYEPAEKDPICYHGVPTFDPDVGIKSSGKKEDLSYSAAFGRWMCDKAEQEQKLMAITPAMRIGSGLVEFAERFKDRFFDVAIAEQHAMILASGLAAGGMRPVVNIYSSFMQRAYDGLIHDMAIQDLPIILCLDRGGLVGPDGPTHNGSFDIAYTRTVPNLLIMAPSSRHELYTMLNTAYAYGHPSVIRYPRDSGESLRAPNGIDQSPALNLTDTIEIGKAQCLNLNQAHIKALNALESDAKAKLYDLLGLSSSMLNEEQVEPTQAASGSEVSTPLGREHQIAILAFGPLAHKLLPLAQEQELSLFNMRFIKPLNEELVKTLAQDYELLVTVEEGAVLGGIGEHVGSLVAAMHDKACRVLSIGIDDKFIPEGSRKEILNIAGLTSEQILERIKEAI